MSLHDATAPRQASGRQQLSMLRMISFAFVAFLPMLVVLAFIIVPGESLFAPPPLLPLLLPVAAGIAGTLGILLVGTRVAPLPAGTDAATAQRLGTARFQTSFFLRLAFAQAPALVGFASIFLGEEVASGVPLFVGVAFSLALHALFAFPGRSVVARVERSLDRDGGRSNLARFFGLDGGRGPTAADKYSGDATFH